MDYVMKTMGRKNENGSTLVCVLLVIFVLSLVGATIAFNCTTQYNVISKQVDSWKLALTAAEAGGDVAFAEVRKILLSPGTQFTGAGWTTPAPSPAPTPGQSWAYALSSFGPSNGLSASVTVDNFTNLAGNGMYRIRSVGTAKVFGLRRTGMNDTLIAGLTRFSSNGTARGDGDSLLRKIDFNYQHFLTTYGDGDKNFGGIASYTVPTDGSGNPVAQVSRRVELIAVPMFPITGMIKTVGAYNGGNGVVDSFDSANGVYDPTVNTNPSSPYYAASQNGNIADGSSTYSQGGQVYGNVTTNGGSASTNNVSGVVDNNVSFTVQPQTLPTHPAYQPAVASTFAPAYNSGATPVGTNWANAPWYLFANLNNGMVINSPVTGENYVVVVVTGDIDDGKNFTVAKGVNVKIYFAGNLSLKLKYYNNNNVDGPPVAPYTNPSRAGHVQFFGINPTAPATQTISFSPPGDFQGSVYAPGADFSMQGNNQFIGAIVCKTFSGNGGTAFHFDDQLASLLDPIDYRVASYAEDIR